MKGMQCFKLSGNQKYFWITLYLTSYMLNLVCLKRDLLRFWNDYQMKMHMSSKYFINPIYTCSILFKQKDDVVTVTGPVAASLKCSRFSDEFDYQPVPKKTCDTSACNGSSPDKVSLGLKCKQLMKKICVEFQKPWGPITIIITTHAMTGSLTCQL